MKVTRLMFVAVFWLFVGCGAQLSPPKCPSVSGYTYIPHPYPCYFYACYNQKLISTKAFECPKDPAYYQRLIASGVQNACSSCAKVYLKPNTPASETPSVPTNPTSTKPTTTSRMTTTSMASTTTTSVMEAMKEIHYVQTGAHLFNGQFAGGVSTLRQCLYRCEETMNCVGFDFNQNDNTCWLHNATNICKEIEEKTGCIHFRLYDKCPMTTSPTPPPGSGFFTTMYPGESTTSGYTMTYRGYHLANGTVIPLALEMATPEACISICRMDMDCAGADFDSGTKSCWLHSEATECSDLIPKPQCTHYRVKEGVCASTTMSYRHTTRSTAAVTTTTTTPSNIGEGTIPEGVTNGFVEAVNNFHVPGGVKMFSDVTLRQCMDSCLVTPYCLALDYDELERTCYFHFQDTYCNVPQELYGVKHYKRLSCVRDVTNDVAATWYHFHVDGGQLLCTGCTLNSCLEACYSDLECAGLDFDMRDLGCYLFKTDTVCGPLIPMDYTIHVSRDPCVPSQLVGLPIQNLVTMTYPTPSGLPSKWQAFPGVRVRNGIQMGGDYLKPDQCVSLCDTDNSCLSGDYDTADGTCWLHLTPETECSQVEASDTVFHFKKQSCEYVYGVMEPYITPVWTAL